MDPEVGAAQDAVIRRWGEKVDATGIWEYDWGRAFYVPRVDFAGSARRLKFLYENGGRAYFAENFHDMLDGPKVYLKARLLEDVDRDPEAVLDEWFVRFAGKAAAPELRSIYRRCEEFWRSEPMKQSAFWRMRRCICITPSDQVFPAIEHGFTEGLLASAQRVRDLASTPGGRRRAEILVRHFELLNCIAAFRGSAWQTPYEGEVKTAESAANMLNAFADAAPGLFDAWNRVERYFSEADFAEPGIYLRRRKVSLDPLAECAVMAAEAMSHIESKEVADAMRRIAGLDCVPGSIKGLFATLTSRNLAENSFSNPGFARPLSEMHVTTYKACRAEIVPCDGADGGRALRVLPDRAGGYAECQLTERLDEGTWLVTARIRGCKRVELVARRQKDGRNREDGVFSHRAVPHGGWRSFARVGRVTKGMDGLNIAFKGVGVEEDGLVVADLHITRL